MQTETAREEARHAAMQASSALNGCLSWVGGAASYAFGVWAGNDHWRSEALRDIAHAREALDQAEALLTQKASETAVVLTGAGNHEEAA